MNIKNFIALITLSFFFGCSDDKKLKEEKESKLDLSDITKNLAGSKASEEDQYAFVKGDVVIILAEELNKDSSNLKVQDFMDDKGSFIPVFTSVEKFKASTKGTKLGKGELAIKGLYLISIMKNEDRIRINPELPDDRYYSGKELKEKFKKEVESLNIH